MKSSACKQYCIFEISNEYFQWRYSMWTSYQLTYKINQDHCQQILLFFIHNIVHLDKDYDKKSRMLDASWKNNYTNFKQETIQLEW